MSRKILIYLLRRDLRLSDNPILSDIARSYAQSRHPFTHLLPVYIFPAQQIEVSGFIPHTSTRSPFPEARSSVAGFWRCGRHRAKFLAESAWDLKSGLESVGSGLCIRVGMLGQVLGEMLEGLKQQDDTEVVGVWMTRDEAVEEKREEEDVKRVAEQKGANFKLWADEKYFVDDRDLPSDKPRDLPDVFTSFRKQVEPLRDAPRGVLPKPTKLPPMPDNIPSQPAPFEIPNTLDELISALHRPIDPSHGLTHPPTYPSNPPAHSAHPFHGGESTGHARIAHLISSGHMSTYKDTRNGMLGTDFSTKLSAWLALGSITARQVHSYLLDFESARTPLGNTAQGYGKGENKGTAAVRFELLWRDFFRLTTRKFGPRLFRPGGFMNVSISWPPPNQAIINRILNGTTGNTFIDASQRELFLTGYTSNRLRQNVASFLSKHMNLDWRIGAEWYESMLVDYDVSSNWGNWQYVSGVGNDPRGEARVFNPVKQCLDYDPSGSYLKAWVQEVRDIAKGENDGQEIDVQMLLQPWRLSPEQRDKAGLKGSEMVDRPLKRIEYNKKPGNGRGRGGGGGGNRGNRGNGRKGGNWNKRNHD